MDFSYNEQGWLKTINQSSLVGVSSALASGFCSPTIPNQSTYTYAANPDPNDLFYLELNYDGIGFAATSLPSNIQKAGNIGLMAYRVKGRDVQAYNYTYDYLNRLENSTHYNVSSSTSVASMSNWYNENLTYDIKGNISTLTRQGYLSTVPTCAYNTIDILSYTYAANTNKLNSIADAANATYRPAGFNPNLGGSGYTYDNNGNLKTDSYKGITNINYNHLNLPSKIEWSTTKSIDFVYTASGMKLAKTVKTGATTNSIQHYMDGIEYNSASGSNRRVEAIYHAEGRFFNTNSGTTTPTFRTEYTIKDHLGNARVTFADLNGNGKIDLTNSTSDNEIIQENHYYAFGMAFEGPWLMNNGSVKDNFYMYNSKEYNADHGLNWNDYGARYYDPSIGRFTGVDALTDEPEQVDKSPYAYAWNNPIVLNDPDGNCPKCVKALAKTVVKSIAKGKLDLGEVYDVIDAGKTLVDPSASIVDKGLAIFDIVSPISTKEIKGVKDAILKTNKTVGKKAEKLVTDDLKKEFPNDEVLEQVTGRFKDGSPTRFDNVVVDAKTGKVNVVNETKSGNAKHSKQQDRYHNKDESVTLTGKNAGAAAGATVNRTTTETRTTRVKP